MSKLPFDAHALSPSDKTIYDEMVAKRKKQGAPFGGPYAALMNHPQLCQKIEALGYYLKFEGHLPRDVYQFVVLCVAKQTNSEFEWQDHLPYAYAAGLPEEVISSLQTQGFSGQTFPEPYHLASQILSETLAWKDIPEPLQQRAIAAFGMEGFIEIVVLSGFYQLFSAINQGFDIQ